MAKDQPAFDRQGQLIRCGNPKWPPRGLSAVLDGLSGNKNIVTKTLRKFIVPECVIPKVQKHDFGGPAVNLDLCRI